MLEALTKKKKSKLITNEIINFTTKQLVTLDTWIKQQVEEKMPLQYLLGSVPFDDIEILVEAPILIPRPETEEMCYNILDMLHKLDDKKLSILDIGTGTGCIALTIAKALPKSTILATDLEERALQLAEKNADHNNIKNVTFLKSDLYESIEKNLTFDLIVSNPPYIAQEEWEALDESVTKWEDKKALVADNKGLAIIAAIVTQSAPFIKKNTQMKQHKIPQLIIEIGHNQGKEVAKIFATAGFQDIKVEKDMEGKDRFVSGRIK